MRKYYLSELAQQDLIEIVDYTLDKWGDRQALKYSNEIQEQLQLLAECPDIGRSCDSLLPGLLRFEVKKHVVFYLRDDDGIRVVRVIHESVMPLPRYFD